MMIECHWRLCADCANNSRLEWSDYEQKWKLKEQPKMTREEAIEIVNKYGFLDSLEKLGLLKFDEPKKEIKHCISFQTVQFGNDIGTVKLEMWPEGLVLWVGGEIKWKSWIDYYKKGDAVTIEYYAGYDVQKRKQAGIIS